MEKLTPDQVKELAKMCKEPTQADYEKAIYDFNESEFESLYFF